MPADRLPSHQGRIRGADDTSLLRLFVRARLTSRWPMARAGRLRAKRSARAIGRELTRRKIAPPGEDP
jgi:hypothetical protein